jgi:hypothetical protein
LIKLLIIYGDHYRNLTHEYYDLEKWQEIEELYRRNHVTMLEVILNLFNNRALSGAPIQSQYIDYWHDYYRNMRETLSAMEIVPLFPAPMDAVEQGRWLTAKGNLLPEVRFDALQTAALSAILIPEEGGKASEADCIAAKSLIQPIIAAPEVHPEATAAYEDGITDFAYHGVAEQIAGRIETTCAK